MYKIDLIELSNNISKYIELAEKEEIQVTRNGNLIFSIVPAKSVLVEKAGSFFGMLPTNATIGVDQNERDS